MFGRGKNKKKATGKGAAKGPNQIDPHNTIEAIGKLKETQTNLEKRATFLRKRAANQFELAKKSNAAKNKDEALHHLKRKKIIDKEIKTIESSILTLDEQVLRIEGGAAVTDVYEALRLANAAMQRVNERVDPDKLADLLGEMEELNADADEAADLLAGRSEEMYTDQALLDEFEKLDADQIEEDAFAIGIAAAPRNKLDETEDLKLLNQLTRQDTTDLKELELLIAPDTKPVIKRPVAVNRDDEALAALEREMLA